MVAYFEKQIPHVTLATGVNNPSIELPLFVTGVDLRSSTR